MSKDVIKRTRIAATVRDMMQSLAHESGSDSRIKSVWVDGEGRATVKVVIPPNEVIGLISGEHK